MWYLPDSHVPRCIAGAVAVLTNAVYFRGKFCIPFRKEAPQPKAFYPADGSEKMVSMMRNRGLPDSYRSGRRFEAAVLRYNDSGIALYLLLPARGTKPERVLTEESVQEMLIAKESISLDLSMPRFSIDFGSYLKASLLRMGIGIAFPYPDADFSAIGSPLFFLDRSSSDCRHNAYNLAQAASYRNKNAGIRPPICRSAQRHDNRCDHICGRSLRPITSSKTCEIVVARTRHQVLLPQISLGSAG